MTRVNCIPVEELTREHLLAEWKELPRVIGLSRAALERGDQRFIKEYRLGQGHVRFFYNKLAWVRERLKLIYAEMKRRGYSPKEELLVVYINNIQSMPMHLLNNWVPSEHDMSVSRARIQERLNAKVA